MTKHKLLILKPKNQNDDKTQEPKIMSFSQKVYLENHKFM